MSDLFYVGLNPRWQMYRFLPQGLNTMFSAAGFWDGHEWRQGRFPKAAGLTFLDCGGFTLLNRHGDYPFTTVNLANLIARLRPDYYVPMDYPCEPEISRQLSLMTNKERIKATVENTLALMDYEAELPGQLVPVIQGHTLDEYQYCLDLHQKAGTIREYMAVGSMCRRMSSEEINEIVPGIYHAAQQAGAKRLHFFGLKLSPDLQPVQRYIHSRDSAVALDSYCPVLRAKRNGRRFPRGQREKREAFSSFLQRVVGLGLQYLRHEPGEIKEVKAHLAFIEGQIEIAELLGDNASVDRHRPLEYLEILQDEALDELERMIL